jgi:uncharacterized protein (TIGR03118 family)
MHPSRWLLTSAVILALQALPASAQSTSTPFYNEIDLATNVGSKADPDLINPWGLTSSPTSPWWLADNGVDKSTLYNAAGEKQARIVDVAGAPTGAVFNPSAAQFVLTVTNNPDGKTGKAVFIFDTEEGTILAWNTTAPENKATQVFPAPGVPASDPAPIYKGLAIAQVDSADPTSWRLYATNFRGGTVDVFDGNFQPVSGAMFQDPTIPEGFAPFGIQAIGNTIYVTYAKQDEDKEDDVAGPGNGFVNAFDLSGNWIARVASGGPLNSPWGLAWASSNFGEFSGQLLVGNFGNGRINAFALQPNGTYEHTGPLHSSDGPPLRIEGLWALQFGKGGSNGNDSQLFFTAGPDDENGGLFGFLTAAGPPGKNKHPQ